MEQFPWNNQMHKGVENIFLRSLGKFGEGELVQLFMEQKVHREMMELLREEKQEAGKIGKKVVKAYRGHLNSVQNRIVEAGEGNEKLRQELEGRAG